MNDHSRVDQPLKWLPHEQATYDEVLELKCGAELQRLARASSQERLAFICDTREVHHRLYSALAPVEHPEYAGTYRGTPGTTLEGRRSGVLREDGLHQAFAAPEKVEQLLNMVADQAKKIFAMPSSTNANVVLSEIVRLFYIFGLVHPFLDGNGHVQRLIFAACVMEQDSLQLCEAWTIHPRPYDLEIKLAFEASTPEARLAALYRVLAAYVIR
jgi:fido (protein-threonine AMPylation protein)